MTKFIAVIDDETEMEFIYSLLLEKLLQDNLVSLKFFTSSSLFLEWPDFHRPDLIMTDINMPGMNGLDLIRRIRSLGHRMPAFFVSGYEETRYRAEMNELGVCRFLAKPLDPQEVLNELTRELRLFPANV